MAPSDMRISRCSSRNLVSDAYGPIVARARAGAAFFAGALAGAFLTGTAFFAGAFLTGTAFFAGALAGAFLTGTAFLAGAAFFAGALAGAFLTGTAFFARSSAGAFLAGAALVVCPFADVREPPLEALLAGVICCSS